MENPSTLPGRLRLVGYPVAAATGVFVSGFGTMWMLWRSDRWPGSPGLFDYASATWGDGLLLPLGAGSLVYAVSTLVEAPKDRWWFLGIGTCGAAIGAATQVSWLLDTSPHTNWTLPEPHRFNLPGWYHAVFLVSASGVFAGLWGLVIRRLMIARRRSLPTAKGVAGAVIALGLGAAFASLVYRDNSLSSHTQASRATVGGLVLGVLGGAALALIGLGRGARCTDPAAEKKAR